MKRLLIIALVGLAAALPLASAQDAEPFIGGGLGVTFADGGSGVGLVLQGGAQDLLGTLGVRGNILIGFQGGVALGVDLLADFPSDDFVPYVGGGFGLIPGGTTVFDLHVTGGAEFYVSDDVALFGELMPKLYIADGTAFGADLRFGANYHFD